MSATIFSFSSQKEVEQKHTHAWVLTDCVFSELGVSKFFLSIHLSFHKLSSCNPKSLSFFGCLLLLMSPLHSLKLDGPSSSQSSAKGIILAAESGIIGNVKFFLIDVWHVATRSFLQARKKKMNVGLHALVSMWDYHGHFANNMTTCIWYTWQKKLAMFSYTSNFYVAIRNCLCNNYPGFNMQKWFKLLTLYFL